MWKCNYILIAYYFFKLFNSEICTRCGNYDKEYIKTVANLFSTPIIFNGSLEILHTSKQKDNYQESINEVLQEENTLLSENMVVGSKN